VSAGGDTALLIDLGSTFTKLRGQGPSTVSTDVTLGLRAALADLRRRLGRLPRFRYRLASSSAAGGLRMVTVGLVRELTAEAARQAALGAGAKLVGTFAGRLTNADLRRVAELSPDVILLAGGTDGGNAEVILHNAGALARCPLAAPVVVAGNREAADAAREALVAAGNPVSLTGNVMPEFGVLDIDPARAAIRRIFIDRIVHAKGIDRARRLVDRVLMPTPAAVLEGARLLADGCAGRAGLGPLLVVDPGGATTDVHSVCDGGPSRPDVVRRGLPEPHLKRTVEGDLGMRHNAASIVEAMGAEALAAAAGLPAGRVAALVRSWVEDVGHLPAGAEEQALDDALARAAVGIAVRRHAGTLETVYTAIGPATVQHGKDLGEVATVIGTGGVLVHSRASHGILSAALADPAEPASLRPRRPRLLLDGAYLLYACGLLGEVAPQAAFDLALAHLEPVSEEPRDARGATV
jgi:uncharacterized protein (TIGR01319 family)